jgi:phosphatidylserine decarboxylase
VIALGLAPETTAAVVGLTVGAGVLLLSAVAMKRWGLWQLGILTVAAGVLTASLYRDPPRPTTVGPGLVLAPADGRVLAVDSIDAPYLGGPARRIRIQIGLFDVHMLRSPVDGVVDYAAPSADGFRLGLSTGLVRVLLELDQPHPRLRVVEGELLDQTQRMGILPTGGALAVLVPGDLQLEVAPGSWIASGVSVLARGGGGI